MTNANDSQSNLFDFFIFSIPLIALLLYSIPPFLQQKKLNISAYYD